MKYILKICLAIIIGQVFSELTITAQDYKNAEVIVSKEVVRKNGNLYYIHIVKHHQTLFSIAKAYQVSIDDIYKLNPQVKKDGLKDGSIIFLPIVKNNNYVKDNTSSVPASKDSNNSTDIKSNKQSDKENKPKYKFDKPSEADHVVHIVKWYENLSDISKKYGISIDELKIFNNLKDNKVKTRTKLFIPNDKDLQIIRNANNNFNENEDELIQKNNQASNIEMSLILPFTINGKPDIHCYDFYSGLLLAIYNSPKKADIKLNVADCSNGLPVLNQTENIIIGPIKPSNLDQIEDNINPNTILVSPLDNNAEYLAQSEDNFIQIPPQINQQHKDLINWLKTELSPEDKVLNISELNEEDSNKNFIDSMLNINRISYSSFSYDILDSRTVASKLIPYLTKYGVNRVVINSDKEGFILDVIRNLNLLLHKKYNIVIYCNSKIRNFDTIDIENLHSLKTHICASYFINYQSDNVKKFVMQYRALFNTDPSRYAFQGYDIATYFIDLYTKYSNNWANHIQKYPKSLLQCNINIKRVNHAGYVNIGVRRVIYNKNLTIEIIDKK